MASKPETTFINSVHRKLPKGDAGPWREKMHNPYRAGTADMWYSGRVGDLWVEYKWIPKLPVRGETHIVPDLSPLQKAWLRDRHTEGRKIVVVIGYPGGVIVFDSPKDWEAGITASEVRTAPLTHLAVVNLIMRYTGAQCSSSQESSEPRQH